MCIRGIYWAEYLDSYPLNHTMHADFISEGAIDVPTMLLMDKDGYPFRVPEDTEVVRVEVEVVVAAEQTVDFKEDVGDIEEAVGTEESSSANFLVGYRAVFITQAVHRLASKCFFKYLLIRKKTGAISPHCELTEIKMTLILQWSVNLLNLRYKLYDAYGGQGT